MKLLTPSGRRSYRRRIVLDLAVLLAAAAVWWWGAGCPLPREAAFHSMERQRLLEPSAVVLETELPGGTEVIAGVTDTRIHAATTASALDRFCWWERTGQPQLILLPAGSRDIITLAAMDVPEGTASARLELTLCLRQGGWDTAGISDRYDLDGTAAGEVFLFTPETQYNGDDSERLLAEELWLEYGYYAQQYRDLPPYTLTFYDAGGQILATVTGDGT